MKILTLLPALVLFAPDYLLAGGSDLYSATVIVTGRDNLAERARGIREALPLVLVKVSADADAGARAIQEGYAAKAETFVERFDYLDRKEGVQISDEQGTRERSFELTVHFAPDEIDKILGKLGASPWLGERPEIGVALRITDTNSTYLLTRSSQKGYGQRAAIEDGAESLGLSVRLPEAEPASVGNAPVRLEGQMTITHRGYWDTDWRLAGSGLDERFAFANTTFDDAIEGALRRSARALATR